MKRRYERPSAYIEEFTPNEYVAACGDHGKVYKFECNAGEKNKQYNVYYFNNGQKKYLTKGGLFGSYYHPCKATHEAEEDTGVISGFIDDQSTWQDEKIPVVIWTDNGRDVHCTTNLNMKEWATAKS